jgi:hypothetical protein
MPRRARPAALARAKQRSAGGQLYPSRSGHLLASAEAKTWLDEVKSPLDSLNNKDKTPKP